MLLIQVNHMNKRVATKVTNRAKRKVREWLWLNSQVLLRWPRLTKTSLKLSNQSHQFKRTKHKMLQ